MDPETTENPSNEFNDFDGFDFGQESNPLETDSAEQTDSSKGTPTDSEQAAGQSAGGAPEGTASPEAPSGQQPAPQQETQEQLQARLMYEAARLESQQAEFSRRQQEAASAQTQQAPQQAPAQGPTQADRKFALQVPDQMVDALRSEDPRLVKSAVEAMVNGAAEMAYRTALTEATEQMRTIASEIYSQQQGTVSQQQQIFNDFYGAYPELNNPDLRIIVRAVGEQVAKELGTSTWGPKLRDLIGTRVRQLLGNRVEQGQQPQAQPQVQPQTPPAAQKKNPLPKMAGGNTRPSGSGPSFGDEIDRLLGVA